MRFLLLILTAKTIAVVAASRVEFLLLPFNHLFSEIL
jgi:hypothetical protein